MTVLMKFCGGCNPEYDRAAFVERLRADFPGAAFVYAGTLDPATGTVTGPAEADVVLVMCGCSVRCAAHSHLIARHAKLIVSSIVDYPAVVETLRTHL